MIVVGGRVCRLAVSLHTAEPYDRFTAKRWIKVIVKQPLAS